MGISYSAKIMIGRPYEDIDFDRLVDEDQDPVDFVWNNGFDWASPYYDSPPEEGLIGVTLLSSSCYSFEEIPEEFKNGVEEAKKKFYDMFGIEAKMYLTVHGD